MTISEQHLWGKYALRDTKSSFCPSHPAVDLLAHGGQSSLSLLHLQQLHQRLDGHPLRPDNQRWNLGWAHKVKVLSMIFFKETFLICLINVLSHQLKSLPSTGIVHRWKLKEHSTTIKVPSKKRFVFFKLLLTWTKTVKRMTTMVVVMKSLFFGKSSMRKTREKQIAPRRPP